MIEDFNIRDNDWDPSYSYHLVYTNMLQEVADSFGLEISTPINPVSTWYIDNYQDLNLVLFNVSPSRIDRIWQSWNFTRPLKPIRLYPLLISIIVEEESI